MVDLQDGIFLDEAKEEQNAQDGKDRQVLADRPQREQGKPRG
jgi:hypothetical protein